MSPKWLSGYIPCLALSKAGLDPSLKRLTCLAPQKNCDTMKLSGNDNIYIYIYIYM